MQSLGVESQFLKPQGQLLFVRYLRSAYRLKPGILKSNELEINKTDDKKFEEKVQDAMLHKQKSPLKMFQRIRLENKYSNKVLPNQPFYEQDDLPIYGSYLSYVKEAERARRKPRDNTIFWKTISYWWNIRHKEYRYTDIGLPLPNMVQSFSEKQTIAKEIKKLRNDPKLERAARYRSLKLEVDKFLDERMKTSVGAIDIYHIALHYGIYYDLFKFYSFYPLVSMSVNFPDDDKDYVNPVYYGNEITPSQASVAPDVTIESEPEQLWCLLLTCPDDNLENNKEEYLHWFVGNIKGGDIINGETIVDYLQPIPQRGTGYHRMIFLLFQQNKKMDFFDEKRKLPCLSLRERNFTTRLFYEKYREHITPVSLCFFQSKWDQSVQDFYQYNLDMPEPVYEFQPWKVDRISRLRLFPYRKTPEWLRKYMPKEPIYPGGGQFT